MFPKQTNTLPMIIDFQFWSFGIGIGDLAHLTRVSLPEDFDIDCHTTLVKKYHETLLLNGVIDYTWETCWNDYRKHVACMMLIPMWQYCSFNLGYEKWCDDMPILVKNYRILECDNLLKIKDLED